MIAPRRSALAKGQSARDLNLAEIATTRAFTRITAGAVLHDGPRGWDASQYRAREYAGDGWLLAGDAGSFIDPLSSAGVKKALASGWLAAIVAHTSLVTPSMRTDARAFFAAREREIERDLSRESRRFLAGVSSSHPRPFWDERSEEDIAAADERESVQRALEHLRNRVSLRATIGPAVTIEPRPCIRGHQIVLEPHVVSSEYRRGVRYIRGVDVVALIDLAPAAGSVPDLYDACVKRLGSTSLQDFLLALATAVGRGWLVAE
jgi:hypothetical protein